MREEAKGLRKDYDKTEDDLKALQSVGQIIGEVLRRLDEERCAHEINHPSTSPMPDDVCWCLGSVIVKASSGPRYVVGCRNKALSPTGTFLPCLPSGVSLLCPPE